jgi:hypothetical protein
MDIEFLELTTVGTTVTARAEGKRFEQQLVLPKQPHVAKQ